MEKRASASKLKAMAREQLLGYYGIMAGTFILMMVISYFLMSIVTGVLSAFALGQGPGFDVSVNEAQNMLSNPKSNLLYDLLMLIIMAVVVPIITILSTGYYYMCLKITKGIYPSSSDLFYCFKNHPDKVIIMALVAYGVQVVLEIPAILYTYNVAGDFSGERFLIYIILILAELLIYLYFSLMINLCYILYLENPEWGAIDCLKASIKLMRGNKWRLFYLQLTFVGYGLLALLSLGVALVWIVPYENMTLVYFYKNITETELAEV